MNTKTVTLVIAAVLLSLQALPASASVCGARGKLDIDICASSPNPPVNKPEPEPKERPLLPSWNPRPTIVAPTDSSGRPARGPGIQWKF